ncbi:MAG: Eco57I restriction-modification methylase domain-containing protein, partial [Prevotellaceae bacterium]|nr:Eco57I restriction-modification methylase domain-containing protein [Prevotellaceae bacterium]
MDYKDKLNRPYERLTWQQLLFSIFGQKVQLLEVASPVIVNSQLARQAFYLGAITLENEKRLAVYEVELADNVNISRNRRGIRNLLTSHWRTDYVGAFVLSYRKNDSVYRFSYVSCFFDVDSKGEYGKKETATKRYTYLLGEDLPCRTAAQRFTILHNSSKALEDVTEAFNVEALSKEFFSRLFQWYQWALSSEAGVTFPDTSGCNQEDVKIKLIRLITRLLFVWFIKQKGLVPDDLFKSSFLKTILKDFNKDSLQDGCYYNAILQNLFFATLNSPIIDDNGKPRSFAEGDSRQPKNLYRYAEMFSISKDEVVKLYSNIPFLNGGLFECLDRPKDKQLNPDAAKVIYYDGFSRNASKLKDKYTQRAFIPNVLFFNDDEKQPGLITLFNEYNFTIEENRTDDVEISLDPELLGHVFENLLATYNLETRENARKANGAFYTPRVIVDYMVDKALMSYLKAKNIEGVTEDSLRSLFENNTKDSAWGKKQTDGITNALKAIKILDPACGSGAFPMGCLTRIVEILELLYNHEVDRYGLKLEIIENCIYGVDIQSIAMMICKLRFFISLICDQEEVDPNKPEKNFGINTLPNLETKFVAANSLIKADIRKYDEELGIDKGQFVINFNSDETLKQQKEELLKIRNQHLLARSRKIKNDLQHKDKEKRKAIHDYILSRVPHPNEKWLAVLEKCLVDLKKERQVYGVKVYLNEIYQEKQTDLFGNYTSLFSKDLHEKKRAEIDKRIKNVEEEINKEKSKGIPQKGYEAAVCQITEWNPYDQNSVCSFFDPEWMFNLSRGFDIVIGNPPYIQLESNRLADLYQNAGYETFARTGDIYCLFYERGYQLLRPGGHLCFITSNKWMRAGYGEKTRSFFAEKTNPELLIDFAGVKIFENATVDTNILLFSTANDEKANDEKGPNQHKTLCAVASKKDKSVITNLSLFV